MRRRKQSGQAIVMVVLALGVLLMGAVGLAIDTGQLYGHRQMAQVAADAAAQAAIISIFAHTNTGANLMDGTTITCTPGDNHSPCQYAEKNGFGSTSKDTVTVDFTFLPPGVDNLSPNFNPNVAHAVVTRNVNATFLRLFGSTTMNIKAAGTAAIVNVVNPVPIIVLHPTLTHSFNAGGNSTIAICGGPKKSIQVNSRGTQGNDKPNATNVGGSQPAIDLRYGGKILSGDCSDPNSTVTAEGSDFGTFGGPAFTTLPWFINPGTDTHYYQPSLPINDPFINVKTPVQVNGAKPGLPSTAPTDILPNTGDCPATIGTSPAKAVSKCTKYYPGLYPNGIAVTNSVAIFQPGLYFMDGPTGANKPGFSTGANGHMIMCKNFCDPAPAEFSDKGMLVYLDSDAGYVDIGANGSIYLKGSDEAGVYKGLLFFGDRLADAHTGAKTHQMGGGGDLGIQGSIYLTNSGLSACITGTEPACDVYQALSINGGGASGTSLRGQIVVSVLQLGGSGAIKMNLSNASILGVDQIALVN